jgi:hypothetical protein
MPIPTKQPQLVDAEQDLALDVIKPADATLMFERLARDKDVDVAKLERLIEMQERILRHQAKAAFDAAFADMQGELPVIDERGAILVNDSLRSKYAKYEDIQAAIRPVLQAHGFSIRHRNESLPDGRLRIVGVLSHREGHSEQDEFICPADKSGGKADIQAIGSTRSYGMRYTTIALLNIETRGLDDDGRAAGAPPKPEAKAPAGFDDFHTDMAAAADEGTPKLMAAWNKADKAQRQHLQATGAWETLKARAAKVKA